MKRINFSKIFISLVFLSIIASGCQKEEGGTVTLNACFDNSGMEKLYIDISNYPCWNTGDAININGSPFTVTPLSNPRTASISNVAIADNYYAIYPATDNSVSGSTGTITLPRTQIYTVSGGKQIVNAPMGAKAVRNDRTLVFHNICSIIEVEVQNSLTSAFTLTEIEMVATKQMLSGTGTVDLSSNDNVLVMSSSSSDISRFVSLSFQNQDGLVSAGTTKSFYIVVPSFNDFPNNVTFTLKDANGTVAQAEYHSVKLAPNYITTVTLNVTKRYLSDLFTVNSNGDKVQFSKGNLQWSPTAGSLLTADGGTATGTWRFATQQYEIVGEDNSNIVNINAATNPYTGYIDLLGAGTSGYQYLPSNYGTSGYCTSTFAGTNHDWGIYNSIINGTYTDAPGTWRVLSSSEWNHVLNERSGSSVGSVTNARYAKATVMGQPGLMLFPDEFEWPSDVPLQSLSINASDGTYSSASFGETDWGKLEEANVIFLPAAGHRVEAGRNQPITSVDVTTPRGLYWSTTQQSDNSDFIIMQFIANDSESNVRVVADARGRYCNGISVRLVKDYHRN